MAPGQYDDPLRDFLDNLPGYVSQFQQNQLALGQQQLEKERYRDDKAYRDTRARVADEKQARLESLNAQRYTAEQNAKHKKELADRLTKEENEKREIVHSLIRAGKTNEALALAKNLQDTELITSLQSINEKEEDRGDDFEAIRSKAGRSDTNPFEYRDEIKTFRDGYDLEPGGSMDRQIFSLESLNNKEINRRNKGMIPVSEWQGLDSEGRADYQALVTAEKVLAELREEQASPTGAITSNLGNIPIDERIEREKEKIRILQSKPRYKLETEAEYRTRKESEKQVSSVLGKADMARSQGLIFPNIDIGAATFDYTPSSDEDLADLNNKINKDLDKVISDPATTVDKDPKEEDYPVATEAVPGLSNEDKRELGMPLLNLPSATAGQKTQEGLAPVDTTLNLGENISAPVQETGSFDVKDIKDSKGVRKNPITGRRYAKELKKLNNLIVRFNEVPDSGNPEFTKRKLQKSIDKISSEIQKEYGEFIDPNTGDFTDEKYTKDFYSYLSIYSDIPEAKLKELFKRFSTAKPSKTVI